MNAAQFHRLTEFERDVPPVGSAGGGEYRRSRILLRELKVYPFGTPLLLPQSDIPPQHAEFVGLAIVHEILVLVAERDDAVSALRNICQPEESAVSRLGEVIGKRVRRIQG